MTAALHGKRIATGALAVVAGLGGLLGMSPTAQASQGQSAAPNIPSCITYTQHKHGHHTNVYIDSSCASQHKVKVVMTHGFDSKCMLIPAGAKNKLFKSYTDDGKTPYVAGLVSC